MGEPQGLGACPRMALCAVNASSFHSVQQATSSDLFSLVSNIWKLFGATSLSFQALCLPQLKSASPARAVMFLGSPSSGWEVVLSLSETCNHLTSGCGLCSLMEKLLYITSCPKGKGIKNSELVNFTASKMWGLLHPILFFKCKFSGCPKEPICTLLQCNAFLLRLWVRLKEI